MSEREKREIQIENRAIGQAVLAAWPSEPTTDRAKRMAEIEARACAATKGPWKWWTSNSHRRLRRPDGGPDVAFGTKQHRHDTGGCRCCNAESLLAKLGHTG